MKILYVEDHSIFTSQVCQQVLSGHDVREAPDLAGARQALSADMQLRPRRLRCALAWKTGN